MSAAVLRPNYMPPGPTVQMKESAKVRNARVLDNNYKGNDICRLDNVVHPNFDPTYIIYDSASDTTYLRGRLLGKGGFARCYELLDLNTNKVYAGKIIAKNRISKPHQRQKILREVELQRCLKHRHIVEFHRYFEDDDNVYIVLENCSRKSLVHVLKHRKCITEPELRFYLHQLVEGVKYIHGQKVIHRDLKLGNMLLNEEMELKIADFGLATKVDYEGEKKMTVCGTPNYIAPEVLQKKGHSYEADIWAVGCISFALLIGRPPFETSSLKETYVRITENTYTFPPGLSSACKTLIRKCLSPNPSDRPTLDEIMTDPFFTAGHFPKSLSPSCCTSMPKFPVHNKSNRPKSYAVPDRPDQGENLGSQLNGMRISPTAEYQREDTEVQMLNRCPLRRAMSPLPVTDFNSIDVEVKPIIADVVREYIDGSRSSTPSSRGSSPKLRSAAMLLDVLSTCLEHMPKDVRCNPRPINELQLPWVTKWVDYSNKYGFGFQLASNVIGVLFNDTSRILLAPDGRAVQFYDLTGKLSTYNVDGVPDELDKKTTLLMYFARYMDEHLIQGGNLDMKELDSWSGGLFLKKWFRTEKAIVLYLSDGTLQVNFFDDHTKIILNYHRNDYLVTYIDESREANTYSMVHLIQDGCRPDIMTRMTFARTMLRNLVDIEGADI